MSSGNSTGQGNPIPDEITGDPATSPGDDPGTSPGDEPFFPDNPHEGPYSWLIHTPDSWARAILTEALRFVRPEMSSSGFEEVRLRMRPEPDGSVRVSLAWSQPPNVKSFRITVRP